ncbi:MAG: ABC transporter permease [Ruminococcaceae bacterium]|nr:ABC transporter permease [Oscillospiraceae bacterium]
MLTIFKREISSYYRSPIAYCIIGFFMVLVGLYFWIQNILNAAPQFSVTLSSLGMFLTFVIPIITMKLLADEKKNGTEVLLRTSPISMAQVVIGKYFAAFAVFMTMVLLTTIFPIILLFIVEGGTSSSSGQDFGAYIGFILLGASYLSVALFTSSFTESQTAAAVSGVVSLLVLYFMQSIGATIGGTVGSILRWFSPLARYSDFTVGSFNFASLIYYITFTALFIYATIINLERKRWI